MEKPTRPQPENKGHPEERRADQARREKAQEAKNRGNAGQSGNIRQNTHNQGYQQDR